MQYPVLNDLPTYRESIDTFGGYNHNLRIGDGEFYDMQNLSSDNYPSLSPRKKRSTEATSITSDTFQGMISKDALCYVKGTYLYINGNAVDGLTLSTSADMCPKQLISMGAYVIIMPDKKWVNTANITQYGDIENEFVASTDVTFSLCKNDGTNINASQSPEPPEKPSNMQMYIDTSTTPYTLRQYSSANSTWTTVPTTYLKVSAPNISQGFSQYDGVKFKNVSIEAIKNLGEDIVLYNVYRDAENGGVGDYLVIVGMINTTQVETYDSESSAHFTISRKMPKMDFIIESNNRLWGCFYGIDNGKVTNEIYASKLGDFKNWSCFMGVSTDSYSASCGTDGKWTGAISYLGYPLFFKENYMHKVFGNYPANYQIQSTACRGVQDGSSKSLAMVNETLFYLSRTGICAYDGSLPSEISSVLGDEKYTDGVAGVLGNKYYISMKDSSDKYNLFVFDVAKRIWHKEDNIQSLEFCNCRGNLYYINDVRKSIINVVGSGDSLETEPVKWYAESGIVGTNMPENKYISKLNVRMALNIGSSVTFSIQYDSQGFYERLFTMTGNSLKSFTVPIKPKRCDHFRIKVEGTGDAKIFSIIKTIEQGSDTV